MRKMLKELIEKVRGIETEEDEEAVMKTLFDVMKHSPKEIAEAYDYDPMTLMDIPQGDFSKKELSDKAFWASMGEVDGPAEEVKGKGEVRVVKDGGGWEYAMLPDGSVKIMTTGKGTSKDLDGVILTSGSAYEAIMDKFGDKPKPKAKPEAHKEMVPDSHGKALREDTGERDPHYGQAHKMDMLSYIRRPEDG